MKSATFVTAFFAFISLMAQDQQATPGSAVHSSRRQEYLALSRQVFFPSTEVEISRRPVDPRPTPEVIEAITSDLHRLVEVQIEASLTNGGSPQDVASAIASLQGEHGFGAQVGSFETNTPFAETFEINGTGILAAGYGVMRGGDAIPDSRAYLEFYSTGKGAPQLLANAPLDFGGGTFFVTSMEAGLAGQAWFLAWGTRFGDTGTRAKLRLYAFDGTSVKTIWKRDGLIAGTVLASRRSISLGYLKEYHAPEWQRVHETLYITPDGLR